MSDYNSSLPVRTESAGDVDVNIYDSTNTYVWDIDSNGIGQVNLNDGTNSLVIDANGNAGTTLFDSAGDQIEINTSGSLLIGDSTADWTFNANGSGKVSVEDDNGDQMLVNPDGSINVNQISTTVGTDIHVYGTVAAGVPGTPNTVVDFTVSGGKTLQLKSYYAACSGKAKFEVKVGPAASEVTQHTGFLSTSSGDKEITFPQPIEVVATDKVLVIVTNNDKANADVYAAINGLETP